MEALYKFLARVLFSFLFMTWRIIKLVIEIPLKVIGGSFGLAALFARLTWPIWVYCIVAWVFNFNTDPHNKATTVELAVMIVCAAIGVFNVLEFFQSHKK